MEQTEPKLVEVLDRIISSAMIERFEANEVIAEGGSPSGIPTVHDISMRIAERVGAELKAFIDDYEEKYFYPPSWRAIAEEFGLDA